MSTPATIPETETSMVQFDPDFEGSYETDWNYDQAHAATQHIQEQMNGFAENMDQLMFDAFSHRVWIGLGYDSWEAWRSSINVRRPITERRALVSRMHKRGMSTRAIGSALNISHMTAQRDLDAVDAGVTDVPSDDIEESETILGTDGKKYARKPKSQGVTDVPADTDNEVIDAEVVEEAQDAALVRSACSTVRKATTAKLLASLTPDQLADLDKTLTVALNRVKRVLAKLDD